MRKNKTGKCHLCGEVKKLTYEHVPPKAAFNKDKKFMYLMEDVLKSENLPWDFSNIKSKQKQRGIGYYTLCGRCNNNTGSWYASAFVDFIRKGYERIYKKQPITNNQIKITLQKIYPLRILKEIIVMFFSINNKNLSTIHQDLRSFVLKKEKRGINNSEYGFYIYLLKGKIARHIGLAGLLSLDKRQTRILSELTAPPFGLVFEIEPNDKSRFCDITYFGHFNYEEKRNISLNLPVLEVNSPFLNDYRTKQKIFKDYIKNKLIEKQLGNNE